MPVRIRLGCSLVVLLVVACAGCERVGNTASPENSERVAPHEPVKPPAPSDESASRATAASRGASDRPPVTLTPAAAAKVQQVVDEHGLLTGASLRVTLQGGGCSGFVYGLGFDEAFDPAADLSFESQGVNVVVAKKTLLFLEGTTIDFVTNGPRGTGFVFENPNTADPTCETDATDEAADSDSVP